MPAAALEISDLLVRYGPRTVVDGLSLTAESGRVTAVLGPNGAGKTTTIECAEGLRRPTGGTIRVLGHAPGSPAARRCTGVMLQDGGLPLGRTAGEVVALAAALHPGTLSGPELLERLGLTAVARTPVRRLSGGQRQRLAFAVALCPQPDLLFLDEPSAGLDPHGRREVWDLVRERRSAGSAVVLTTHLLEEAQELADVVHVLVAGRVVASGSPVELIARYAGSDTLRLVLTRPLDAHEEQALAQRLAPCRLERDAEAYVVRGVTEAATPHPATSTAHPAPTSEATPARGTSQTAVTRAIATWCDEVGIPILGLRAGGGTLEHAYLALADGPLGEASLEEMHVTEPDSRETE